MQIPRFDGNLFRPELIDTIEPQDIRLNDYQHHPAIRAEMAV